MDRTIFWSQNQSRTFDLVEGDHDVLVALGTVVEDILNSTTTVLSGFAASQTTVPSLTINLAAGRIYQQADADATANGAIPQDTTIITQQGFLAASQVILSTAGITTGQSRWALIEAQYSQVDSIRTDDPNGGLLFFYNSANPNEPFQGPGNDGATTPTVRQGLVVVQVVQGSAATTGSEVPPSVTSGWVPLYLVDLSYGQTAITTGEILTAGPSVGTGVPNNYPYAPFLAGLLNSHHNGNPGQAPKINLATETQGTLPAGSSHGNLLNVQIFTTSGIYNANAAATKILVEAVGGGGAGGGSPAITGSNYAVGGGGGAGAYVKSLLTSGFSGGITVTIGAAGTAGNGTGGNGGTTSFGTIITCPGGFGGTASGSFSGVGNAVPGGQSTAPSGTVGFGETGQGGSAGWGVVSSNVSAGGNGGSGTFGQGGPITATSAATSGKAATGYGAGGGGVNVNNANAAQLGGAATAGIVIIYEYS